MPATSVDILSLLFVDFDPEDIGVIGADAAEDASAERGNAPPSAGREHYFEVG